MHTPAQSPLGNPEFNLSRRKILQWLWGMPVVAVILQMGGMIFSFSLPRKKAGTFGTVIDIGPLAEMPAPVDSPLHHSRGKFWLISNKDGLVALSNTCSHLDCLFNWNQEAGCFICPCHGSQFDRNGLVLMGPATRNLDRFPLLVVAADGKIIAQTPSEGKPLPIPNVNPPADPAGSAEPAVVAHTLPRVQVDTSRRISGTTITS